VDGALSYRAHVVTPPGAHRLAVEQTFARAHPGAAAVAQVGLREATHLSVLGALARFASPGGEIVTECFRWSEGAGWRHLGATCARCPSVPPEVRSVRRLTRCQTA
jgi:hypothetical protein